MARLLQRAPQPVHPVPELAQEPSAGQQLARGGCAHQGRILQNFISAKKFSEKFSSLIFEQSSTQKKKLLNLGILAHNLLFKSNLKQFFHKSSI
jgi:hypothetical protein